MKQLIKTIKKYELKFKNGKVWTGECTDEELRYIEPPEKDQIVYNNFEELREVKLPYGLTIFRRFLRKESGLYLWSWSNCANELLCAEHKFESLTIYNSYRVMKPQYTVTELMEDLPADDFVEWVKDKVINLSINL